MKDLKIILKRSNKLYALIEDEKFDEENIRVIKVLTKQIKKYIINFERRYDFFDRNIEMENLSGGCVKQFMLIMKEVMSWFIFEFFFP